MKEFHIAGYAYRAENYTPARLLCMMLESGELSPAANDMRAEEALDQLAGAMGIDRTDERSFDSSEFPKVIFWSQVTDDDRDRLEE